MISYHQHSTSKKLCRLLKQLKLKDVLFKWTTSYDISMTPYFKDNRLFFLIDVIISQIDDISKNWLIMMT